MNSAASPSVPGWLSRLSRRCFQPQILNFHCISTRAGRSVSLPSAALSSADEIKFIFDVRRPLFAFRNSTPVCVRLFSGCIPLAETLACHCWSRRSITRVEAGFPGHLLDGLSKVALELTRSTAESGLWQFCVDVLGPLQAQRFRAGLLRAESRRLWIKSGTRWRLGDLVPHTSDAVIPELTVRATAVCALLPACARRIDFDLISDRQRIRFGSRKVVLCGDAVKMHGPRVSVRDLIAISPSGSYRIAASLDGRDLAVFPFRVLGSGEWLDLVEVWPAGLVAETNVGGDVMRTHTLCRNRHVAFRPCLHLKTSVPAPNTLVRCEWRLISETSELGRGEFITRLQSAMEAINLDRFDLQRIEGEGRNRDARLWLTVDLEGKRKLSWPIVIAGTDPISDFEGQLCRDAKEFPVDEEAYAEIIAGLTASPQSLRSK